MFVDETDKACWKVAVVEGAGTVMGVTGGVVLKGVGMGIVGSVKSTVLFPKKLESVSMSKFDNPEKSKS